MADDVREKLQSVLQELRRLPDVLAVAIARRDGIMIAHSLPRTMDPRRIAAMAASIVGTSEMAAEEVGQGPFVESIVESRDSKMLATGAGEEAILVTMVRTDANMGLVLISVDRAVSTIANLLAGPATESPEVRA
ncbi:MAG TPA: roadblock/LC7 domain-containing protein [Thermoplasmata archaeon]